MAHAVLTLFRGEGLEAGAVGVEDHRCWAGGGGDGCAWADGWCQCVAHWGGVSPILLATLEQPVVDANGEVGEVLDGFEGFVRKCEGVLDLWLEASIILCLEGLVIPS